MTRGQLSAICRLLELTPIGTSNFLRLQVNLCFEDKWIKLNSLLNNSEIIFWKPVWQVCRFDWIRITSLNYNYNIYLFNCQIEMRLRHLKTDDKLIIKEGLNNMTVQELQQACKERGMRALGISEAALKRQMQEWLDLSQNAKVPPSLLLLSRTLYFAERAQPTEQVVKEEYTLIIQFFSCITCVRYFICSRSVILFLNLMRFTLFISTLDLYDFLFCHIL